ncbi:MAG: flagellar basal body-associated FliL family protein [bacterium]|nr:flagellar basal body-associated FliL family protein [bacterium]
MAIDEEEIIDEEDDELNIPAIILTAVLVLALIGGAVWYFFIREPPEEDEEKGLVWETPTNVQKEILFKMLPELVINPRDSRGRVYLIVKIDVVLNEDIRSQFLNKLWILPEAQNAIIDIFNSYSLDELRTPKLKEEARLQIKEEFNIILGWTGDPDTPAPDGSLPPVKNIYITKYIFN